MRTTRKILVLLAVVAVMVAALVVSSYAYINYDPSTNKFPGGSTTGYKDLYSEGWAQIAGGSNVKVNDDGDYDDEGELYKSNGSYRVYYNASTKTVVIDMANDGNSITGGNNDYKNVAHVAYWFNANSENVTTLEVRNVGHLNNAAYVWNRLKHVKTIKINANCDRQNGSKSDTGAFSGLTSLETVIWGTWDKATGEFTKVRGGEDGVIDLGGFIYLDANPTTYDGSHYMMYGGSAVRGTSVKKLILPYSQITKDVNRTYTLTAISDGTFIEANSKLSSYGTVIAAGKACGVFTKVDTGETVYTVQSYSGGYNSSEIKPVTVKAVEQAPFYGDYTGIIPYRIAESCTKLEEVVVPAEVVLKYIESSAFSGCTALKLIDIKGSIASDFYIENKDAFKNVTGLVINVQSARDQVYMQNALAAVQATGITVVNVNPPEETDLDKAIVAAGYSIRLTDENAKTKGPALRAEFTLKDSVLANAEQTLVDFGVIVFSANTFTNVYDSNIYNIYDEALKSDAERDTRIIRKSAKNGPYVRVANNGDITFAAAVTGIPVGNYNSAIYTYAYAVWSDGTITYTTYTSENTGKTAHALYDLTMYLFKNGLVNSEIMDEDKLWGVLSTGAVAYEGNIRGDQKSDPANYTNATHYLDNPLFAYSNYTTFWGASSTATLEDTSSTNINWSILADGDEYVVVYRNAGGEGEALLPAAYPSYTDACQVFSSNYNRADAKTPALMSSAYQKIKTVVIDYGVDGVGIIGDGALSGMAYVTTIVYPNGFDEICYPRRDWGKDSNDVDGDGDTNEYLLDIGYKDSSTGAVVNALDGNLTNGDVNNVLTYLLYGNSVLKDIIWANNDGIPHMQDFIIAEGDVPMEHLFDMRGMGKWSANNKGMFDGVSLVENIVFGDVPGRNIYGATFASATAIQRVWYETEHTPGKTYAAPAYKTIDIGVNGGWGKTEGAAFNVKSNGYVIKIYSSSFAGNCDFSAACFFGGDDASTLTVRVVTVGSSGAAVAPDSAVTRLLAKITDTNVSDRIYFYYPDTGEYKNPAGTVFAG